MSTTTSASAYPIYVSPHWSNLSPKQGQDFSRTDQLNVRWLGSFWAQLHTCYLKMSLLIGGEVNDPLKGPLVPTAADLQGVFPSGVEKMVTDRACADCVRPGDNNMSDLSKYKLDNVSTTINKYLFQDQDVGKILNKWIVYDILVNTTSAAFEKYLTTLLMDDQKKYRPSFLCYSAKNVLENLDWTKINSMATPKYCLLEPCGFTKYGTSLELPITFGSFDDYGLQGLSYLRENISNDLGTSFTQKPLGCSQSIDICQFNFNQKVDTIIMKNNKINCDTHHKGGTRRHQHHHQHRPPKVLRRRSSSGGMD